MLLNPFPTPYVLIYLAELCEIYDIKGDLEVYYANGGYLVVEKAGLCNE